MRFCDKCDCAAGWYIKVLTIGLYKRQTGFGPANGFACNKHKEELQKEIEELVGIIDKIFNHPYHRMFSKVIVSPLPVTAWLSSPLTRRN